MIPTNSPWGAVQDRAEASMPQPEECFLLWRKPRAGLHIPMINFIRYLYIVHWARRRYTHDGVLPISRGLKPSPYSRIEALAWERYMS